MGVEEEIKATSRYRLNFPNEFPYRATENPKVIAAMARRSNNETEQIANVLRLLPAKYVVALIAAVLLYFVMQPRLNAWFGWNLPSVAAMLGQEPPAKPPAKTTSSKPTLSPSESSKATASKATDSNKQEISPAGSTKTTPSQSDLTKPTTSTKSTATPKSTASTAANNKDNASAPLPDIFNQPDPVANDAKYRILKPVGRDRYESPAGLIYAPGSEEGHRLDHIAKHLQDQPDRPGSHGVFDGGMAEFLVAIDDAYKRAKGHAKGTKSRVEDGATILEAPFDKPIGYLGGTEGARRKNPKLKRMRIVLRDRNLITAFPIQ